MASTVPCPSDMIVVTAAGTEISLGHSSSLHLLLAADGLLPATIKIVVSGEASAAPLAAAVAGLHNGAANYLSAF